MKNREMKAETEKLGRGLLQQSRQDRCMALTRLATRNDWIQDLGGDRVGKTLE